MKKFNVLILILVLFLGVNAQENTGGEWQTIAGESVFVETGSSRDNIEPGTPSPIITSPPSGTTLINFDDVSAPCCFSLTVPISNEYAAQGVTFSGIGFSLLDQSGNFYVNGYSPPNFIAWNPRYSSLSETMTFSPVVKNVSFLAGTRVRSTLTAEAFDGNGQSLGIVVVPINDVAQTVSLPFSGIAEVKIDIVGGYGIIDDLMFESDGLPQVPVSDWAIYFGIFLIVGFMVLRYRRRLA